jgi:predicted metal-dependent enzyme (double-stranded beta helix superfamily)
MHNTPMPSSLQIFTDRINELLDANHAEPVFLPKIAEAMSELVSQDNWLNDAFAKPHPEYYQQYLLYAAPDDQFSVVSFVWGPGQSTPVHDHTVWGVIGVLRGAELVENFEQGENNVSLVAGVESRLDTGDVGLVSPTIGDIHRVKNAYDDKVSISIHAYGSNIGKTSRHVFPPEGGVKEFISGYANNAE